MANRVIEEISDEIFNFFDDLAYLDATDDNLATITNSFNDMLLERIESSKRTREYFDKKEEKEMTLSSEYDSLYQSCPTRWSGGGRDSFLTENLEEVDSVLDIGCGTGHTLKHIGEVWKSKLYGLDFSSEAIKIASKNVPDGIFFKGTIDDIEGQFDLVILMGVGEHFEDHKELGKIRKLMKGLLYMEIPNCLSYSGKGEGFYGNHQKEWHLQRDKWESILKENGFEIVKSLVGKKPAWEFIWVLK
jgi:SAM-dependent methyltransferase